LSFVPGSSDDFVNAIKQRAHFSDAEFGVKYHVEARQVETIGEMKSGKWVAYAARALVVRFWDLAKVCNFPILSTHPVLIARPSAESGLT
jgi:hydroxymethylglutaryl-CoA reductase (NADPH)